MFVPNILINLYLVLYWSCYEGYLEVNLKGTLGVGAFDERFCGSLLPPNLTSEDSRMILTLDTHKSRSSRGFSSIYQFITGIYLSWFYQ